MVILNCINISQHYVFLLYFWSNKCSLKARFTNSSRQPFDVKIVLSGFTEDAQWRISAEKACSLMCVLSVNHSPPISVFMELRSNANLPRLVNLALSEQKRLLSKTLKNLTGPKLLNLSVYSQHILIVNFTDTHHWLSWVNVLNRLWCLKAPQTSLG